MLCPGQYILVESVSYSQKNLILKQRLLIVFSDSKVKARLKLLGLSDEDDEGESFETLENGNDKNDQDLSSETSSSPELDDQDDVIPTHAPNEKSPIIEEHKEDEIVINELSHDEKVEKLQETIQLLQQQMAEGNDHIAFEMKMREKEKENDKSEDKEGKNGLKSPHRKAFKPPRKVEKSKKTPEKSKKTPEKSKKTPEKSKTPEKCKKTPEKMGNIDRFFTKEKSKTPEKSGTPERKEKHKIKVRVEMDRKTVKVDQSEKIKSKEAKKSKSETADILVKLLVPYFKKGKIGSKDVFKITARELTHNILKKSTQICKSDYSNFVDKFFASSGVLLSEDDVKKEIANFNF